jgi:hypothetical protein
VFPCGQMDKLPNLIVAFRNSANVPNKNESNGQMDFPCHPRPGWNFLCPCLSNYKINSVIYLLMYKPTVNYEYISDVTFLKREELGEPDH